MKKFNKIAIIYFLVFLPFLALGMAMDAGDAFFTNAKTDSMMSFLNGLVGLTFGLWIVSAIYLSLALVISEQFREQLLSKIIRIKERDERESVSVGIISKKVFLSSITITVLLLVLSLLQINLQKIPTEQQIDNKGHTISLGLKFSMWEEPVIKKESSPLYYYDFPFSAQGILILILIWNLLTFHFYSRNLNTEEG